MDITLKVTPAELKRMSGDIRELIKDIQLQFDEIGQAVTQSRYYWEGDASNFHQKQYECIKDDIAQVIKDLQSHPENLLKMAGLYEETERQATERTESLLQDVII